MRTIIACANLHNVKQPISFPRPHCCVRALPLCFTHPRWGVGGAPRDVRVLGGTPVGVHVTRHARRLARRHASHDAGRSPLGAPPWRFWALRVPRFPPRRPPQLDAAAGGSVTASSSRPGLSAWRAGSLPPGAAVASRYRRTPHLAPHSGCLENTHQPRFVVKKNSICREMRYAVTERLRAEWRTSGVSSSRFLRTSTGS
jgi:hypothetical protein